MTTDKTPTMTARQLTRHYDDTNWLRRTEYPSDGAVVAGGVRTTDRKLVILYDDRSYLVVNNVTPRKRRVAK